MMALMMTLILTPMPVSDAWTPLHTAVFERESLLPTAHDHERGYH